MPSVELRIRGAQPADVRAIVAFIRELAEFEKLSHEVVVEERDLSDALFGARPAAEVVIAEIDDEPVGFALFFTSFSTFLGRRGLYLEDLYVTPGHRGRGIGRSLLAHLAQLAEARGYGRMEWAVLNWNQSAIALYERMGAVSMSEWTTYRLSGKPLSDVGR
jgi:GNAT superfamily N-acetyltransferase